MVGNLEHGLQYEDMTAWQSVVNRILNPFRNYLIPKRLLCGIVTRSRSPLIQESLRTPGGWPSMRLLYDNAAPISLLDRLALQSSPMSKATRNRRKFITAKLTELIRTASENRPINQAITIVGVGAGPGVHVQDAVLQSGVAASQIRAYLVDLDESAFPAGRQRAAKLGIADSIHFIKADARQIGDLVPDVRADIVKIVGLIEYLSDQEVVHLFEAMHAIMTDGATLLTHGIVDTYGNAPFLKRVFGLRHKQRTGKQVRELLRTAGLTEHEEYHLPMKMFPIVIAKEPSS